MSANAKSKKSVSAAESSEGFTAEERAAMKERATEIKTTARRGPAAKKAAEAADVLSKIAEMAPADRDLATRVHAIITSAAPELDPKLWYGMPAYARDGKVLCFLQAAEKFKTRYATLGFNDIANLDDGSMWPSAYALTSLAKADEKRIADLIKRAVA